MQIKNFNFTNANLFRNNLTADIHVFLSILVLAVNPDLEKLKFEIRKF